MSPVQVTIEMRYRVNDKMVASREITEDINGETAEFFQRVLVEVTKDLGQIVQAAIQRVRDGQHQPNDGGGG